MTITNKVSLKSVNGGNTPVADVVDAPTIGTATAGTEAATVAYTAATTGGAATSYGAISTPGSVTGTSATSPITVSGLTGGTAYTFKTYGINDAGTWSSVLSAASNSVTPAVATSFESIATSSPTSGTSITFSSIPNTYKSLQIRATYKDSSTTDWTPTQVATLIRFNGSSGSNYISHQGYGTGATAVGNNPPTGDTYIYVRGTYISSIAAYANMAGAMIIDVYDYASTTKNKTIKYLSGNDANANGTTNRVVAFGHGLWLVTTAVSSITLYSADTGFTTGTTFALYGIK